MTDPIKYDRETKATARILNWLSVHATVGDINYTKVKVEIGEHTYLVTVKELY